MLKKIIREETAELCVTVSEKITAVISKSLQDNTAIISISIPYQGVYGMGEKFNGLNQKGSAAENQIIEKFCYQGDKTYCAAPFFVTNTGFGIYVDTMQKTMFAFGDQIRLTIPESAPIFVFTGTIPEIISDYMKLTGPVKLPPKYAFGVWISANHWNCQQKVLEQLSFIEQYQYPVNVIVLEAWSDEATFYIWHGAKYQPSAERALIYEDFDFSSSDYWPDPANLINTLHKQGIRLVLWQIPVYKKQSIDENICHQLELDKKEAVTNRLCVMKTDQSPYQIPEGNWFAGSMIPDFTNEATKESWFAKRQYLLDMGIDGFKTDGGEFIYQHDITFANKTDGRQAKNQYAQDYTKAYTEFLNENKVLFSRAGFTGAHTTPILWSGDQQSDNEELKSVLSAGLSAAMTGIPFWSFDIAGFAGTLPSLDLYRRATQFSCFCPVMQWHSEPDGGQFKELMPGASGNNERSPWNMALAHQCPEFVEEIRFWYYLRLNMLPYLYSEALKCRHENRPMMKPLVYQWPGDGEAVKAVDEYMLGDSLLVAPLLEESSRQREVYLPAGDWYGLFTHKKYPGGERIISDEQERMPVYLRAGTALVVQQNAADDLGGYVSNQVYGIDHIHLVLAGSRGSYDFYDELQHIHMDWKDKEVIVHAMDDMHISWEVID